LQNYSWEYKPERKNIMLYLKKSHILNYNRKLLSARPIRKELQREWYFVLKSLLVREFLRNECKIIFFSFWKRYFELLKIHKFWLKCLKLRRYIFKIMKRTLLTEYKDKNTTSLFQIVYIFEKNMEKIVNIFCLILN
jgi:hypothetical protein